MVLKIKSAMRGLLAKNSWSLIGYTLLFSLTPVFSGFFQFFIFAAWLLFSIYFIRHVFLGRSPVLSWLLSFLFCFTSFSFSSLAFLLLRILTPFTAWISLIPIFLLSAYCLMRQKRRVLFSGEFKVLLRATLEDPFSIILFTSFLTLFFLLLLSRTFEPLVSPWLIVPPLAFLLYFINSFILIWRANVFRFHAWLAFSFIHILVSVIVSVAVYGVGFGFDPFIHRAAQDFIVENGYIDPFQFFYMGQYSFVTALHHVSGISARMLDILYVPVLTSLLIPTTSYIGLKEGWGASETVSRLGWIAALIVPYSLLTFSVPFTLTYLQFLLFFFVFPLFFKLPLAPRLLLATFFVIGFSFHPLLLFPLLFLIVAGLVPRMASSMSTTWFVGAALAFSVLLPIAFLVYQSQTGVSTSLYSLFNYTEFTSLFINIFGGWDFRVTPFLNVIYVVRYWLPIFILFAGSLGIWLSTFSQKRYYFAFLFIIAFNIYALSTLFYFENIISHEQKEFAFRLLQGLYASGGVGFVLLLSHLSWKRVRIPVAISVGLLLTLSWFFSYPQYNAKFAFTSPSVSSYDLEAVRAIETYADGSSYVALSNQMTAAASLQEFGFNQYVDYLGEQVLRYPIPTGGSLYSYYLRSLFEGDLEAIDELQLNTGVESVFLVHHSYWPIRPEFFLLLEESSSDIIHIDNKITIFIFSYASQNDDKDEYENIY